MVMLKYAKKLNEILKVGNKVNRQQALIEYAQSLHVSFDGLRKPNGEVDEDQLTVLLFNAERTRTWFRLRRMGVLAGGFFVLMMLIAAIFLFVKF